MISQTARPPPPAPARTRAAAAGHVPWIVIAVTVVTLLIRVDYPIASGRFLWAEDGYTFFNHARTDGFATVALPYEGYLHVLPRLVAWSSRDLPLALLPFVYSGAWIVALAVMVGTVVTRGRAMGMDATTVCGVALLCVFQPTSAEMFFNLTNAQWLLGVALTLQTLTRDEWPEPSWRLVGLVLLCLTGPFCLIILPLVVAFHLGRRPKAATLVALGCFAACVMVQLFFLLTTDRLAGRAEHVEPWQVVKSMVQLFLFLPGRLLEWFSAIGFWSIYGLLLVVTIVKRETRQTNRTRTIVLLVAAAVAFLAASMVSGAFPPRAVRDGFNRYTWIPFALVVFTAAMLSSASRAARLAMALFLSIICFSKFAPISRPDLHYPSFVKLAERLPVAIPINPITPQRSWQMEVGTVGTPDAVPGEAERIRRGLASRTRDGADAFAELAGQRIVCADATDIAIEVDGEHALDGRVTLTWSPSSDFVRPESMQRLYRRGVVRMQYAFPYPANGVYLRSNELSDPAVVAVRSVAVFCLR